MHLWPSERLRESFKKAYLDKLELNLGRMKREKRQISNQQRLLDGDNCGGDCSCNDKADDDSNYRCGLLRDLLLIISCCYCCFCCGACIEEEN